MKYFIVLLIAAAVCFVCLRGGSVASVAKTATDVSAADSIKAPSEPSKTASSNVLKRPLDRTHEVLHQVSKNTADNAF